MNSKEQAKEEVNGNKVSSGEKPPKSYKSKIFDPPAWKKLRRQTAKQYEGRELEDIIIENGREAAITAGALLKGGSQKIDLLKLCLDKSTPDLIRVQRNNILSLSIRDLETLWLDLQERKLIPTGKLQNSDTQNWIELKPSETIKEQ